MNELIMNNNTKSNIKETIINIKTNLQYKKQKTKIKTILITSPTGKEGKTFICANLSIAYANTSKKVLLIDSDLRTGRQHQIFNIPNQKGLTELLKDEEYKDNLTNYINKTNYASLDIITKGSPPKEPTTVLEQPKLDEIIKELKNKYDIIIIDTPHVIGLNDTIILTRIADTSLIVATPNKTKKESLKITKEILTKTKTTISGVILNKI